MQTKIQKIVGKTRGVQKQIADTSGLSISTITRAIQGHRVDHMTRIDIYSALLKLEYIKLGECNAYTLFE